jgi:predicted nucleic acid-binding protein
MSYHGSEMARIPRIYLDACALIRLFDRQSQARIRAESHAAEEFFTLFFQGTVRWVSSEVLEAEILNNPYSDKRPEVLELLALSTERIIVTDEGFQRADALEMLGHGAFDALHLACAEEAQVDGLLTTDDRFIRRVQRGLGNSAIRVENPVNWRRGFAP